MLSANCSNVRLLVVYAIPLVEEDESIGLRNTLPEEEWIDKSSFVTTVRESSLFTNHTLAEGRRAYLTDWKKPASVPLRVLMALTTRTKTSVPHNQDVKDMPRLRRGPPISRC